MPSKGITVYSYISVEGYEVEFSVPKVSILNTSADNFTSKVIEMESSNIEGKGNFTGRFEWKVIRDGELIGSAFNNINSFTGNLHGGTMISTSSFIPIVTDDVIITYGFYDAGHGEAGLTNRDQCYVTVCSRANRYWMGAVAPPSSPEAQKPFSRFVLAAPHDNGMNSMQTCKSVLDVLDEEALSDLREILPPQLRFFDDVPTNVLLQMLPNIVYGMAITQKKEIPIMLDLGARYFEFRPAKLLPVFQRISSLPNKFYFQHACIPGLDFDTFLDQLVAFLDENATEIVTIHIRSDNIIKDCILPTEQEVADMLTAACAKASRNHLTWGARECFSQPIDTLRSNGRRLICVNHAEKYDSWTAKAYATLSVDPILARFESMETAGQESTDLTILQCQATSQSIKEVLMYSVVSANAATSCLTSTKAALDMHTLPWIRRNAIERLQAEKTIVIMNDFIDGATTDTSIELSRRRLQM